MRTLWAMALLATATQGHANPIYASTCGLCHQNEGAGVPGQFPRLAGRVERLAADAGGRDYLLHTVLFGMAGRIEVDGATLVGVMPSFLSLSDADLAGVLNYLVRLKGVGSKPVKAFSAAEVAAVRNGPRSTPSDVSAMRGILVAAGRMP